MATIYDIPDEKVPEFIALIKSSVSNVVEMDKMPGALKDGVELHEESVQIGLVTGFLLMCDPQMRKTVDLLLEFAALEGAKR